MESGESENTRRFYCKRSCTVWIGTRGTSFSLVILKKGRPFVHRWRVMGVCFVFFKAQCISFCVGHWIFQHDMPEGKTWSLFIFRLKCKASHYFSSRVRYSFRHCGGVQPGMVEVRLVAPQGRDTETPWRSFSRKKLVLGQKATLRITDNLARAINIEINRGRLFWGHPWI